MTERPGETAGPTGAAPARVHASDDHASNEYASSPAQQTSSPAKAIHAHDQGGSCCAGHDHGHSHAVSPLPIDPTALISARGLKIVRSGRTILSDINLDIHAREILTLIGPNGAGKTTLVRALMGLERPDAGIVARKPGLSIGYVPQRFDIDRTLPMTVERFLSLGDGGRKGRIRRVLEEVGASRVVNQQLSELSGGELQRVVLARALLNDPALLVLDEPVSGVDYVGEAELYGLIDRLRDSHGFGVLLISHDLHIVMAQSDRVLCINRHVCCSGVPEAVAQHPEYTRLFGPEEARTFAVYQHHHDHRHDLSGDTAPTRGGNGLAEGEQENSLAGGERKSGLAEGGPKT